MNTIKLEIEKLKLSAKQLKLCNKIEECNLELERSEPISNKDKKKLEIKIQKFCKKLDGFVEKNIRLGEKISQKQLEKDVESLKKKLKLSPGFSIDDDLLRQKVLEDDNYHYFNGKIYFLDNWDKSTLIAYVKYLRVNLDEALE